jgi:hypothetical protein
MSRQFLEPSLTERDAAVLFHHSSNVANEAWAIHSSLPN